ncbi:MAG: WcaI family glycosyltransferase [Fusobacteriaceae bacterium]
MNKKKILLVGLNYYPEESAIGLYSTEMCEYLAKEFQMEVITGYPYYPEWKIRDDYKEKNGVIYEEKNGVKISRVKQYTPKKVDAFRRLYHYWDFYKKAMKIAEDGEYDLVQVILPNIFLLKLAINLKKDNKSKMIWAHVQDFEIDAGLETLKWIGKIPLVKYPLHWIEKTLFSKFDIVSSISDGMVKILANKGVDFENRYFLPNWSDVSKLYKIEKSEYRKELKIKDEDFVVMYSGNIGGKQDWETTIQAIKKLQNHENIKFVIAGDGNRKEYVSKELLNLKNVILLPLQPKKRLNDFLNLGDLHFIPQKPDAKDSFMPSKLLGIMSVEKPVLILANKGSNLYEVIKKEKLGYVLSENEYEKFSDTVLAIEKNKVENEIMGSRARKYVLENYVYETVMRKLIEKIKKQLIKNV